MLAYFVRRLFVMIPTLLAISAIVFFIIQLPPGDYLSNQIAELRAQGEAASMAQIEHLRAQYHLDKTPVERYFIWLFGLLHGDLGWSFEYDLPVNVVIGDRLVLSFVVGFATVIFTYAVAFPIGIYSATRQYSWGDYGLTFLGFLGLATPSFLLALVMLYLANIWFGTAIGGLMDPEFVDKPMSWAKFLSVLEHLWIPVVVIGTSGTAAMIRRLRANLLDELQKQYVVTARAKGISRLRVALLHAFKNALIPVVTVVGLQFGALLTGAILTETIFSWPGLGRLLIQAIRLRDYPLVQGCVLLISVTYVAVNLATDLLYAWLDPRIRLQDAKAEAGR